MGHLPIVTKGSLKRMIRNGAVLVKVPAKHCKPSQKWADILADALCVRKGDSIYPWMVKSKKAGFSYRFIASDSAFLVDEDVITSASLSNRSISRACRISPKERPCTCSPAARVTVSFGTLSGKSL